jgi:nucleotide-binding universal stress UspA family protein
VNAPHGILLGYDGSPGSDEALGWAAREARSRGSMLTVCLAWAPGYPAPDAEVAVFARRTGERTLARGLRRAQDLVGSGEIRPLLADGPAASALCELSGDAEMVVVGSRGQGGLAGLLLGSVSSQVAAHAHGRVVVVRGHWQRVSGHVAAPIVAGTEGSAASVAAVEFAFEEAALRGTALLAVCALADAPGVLGGSGQIRRDFEDLITRSEKGHPGVTVRRQIAEGSARSALLAAAFEAQMLVVGARGLGGVRGMMLGSVSHTLLQHAPCPVGVARVTRTGPPPSHRGTLLVGNLEA